MRHHFACRRKAFLRITWRSYNRDLQQVHLKLERLSVNEYWRSTYQFKDSNGYHLSRTKFEGPTSVSEFTVDSGDFSQIKLILERQKAWEHRSIEILRTLCHRTTWTLPRPRLPWPPQLFSVSAL
jgi:hypothetical protein